MSTRQYSAWAAGRRIVTIDTAGSGSVESAQASPHSRKAASTYSGPGQLPRWRAARSLLGACRVSPKPRGQGSELWHHGLGGTLGLGLGLGLGFIDERAGAPCSSTPSAAHLERLSAAPQCERSAAVSAQNRKPEALSSCMVIGLGLGLGLGLGPGLLLGLGPGPGLGLGLYIGLGLGLG